MRFDPDIHRRRSIRLQGYDYAQAGAYFITVCTQDRVCIFGEVVDGEMRLNDAGRMVEQWWLELEKKFLGAKEDVSVVMPNHFHGIVILAGDNRSTDVGADLRVCPGPSEPQGAHMETQSAHTGAPLSRIVQWFKTMTTNEYIKGVKELGWTPFRGRLWQRNYYEHIIRDDRELDAVRQYIVDNPAKWAEDRENPRNWSIR
jgi:putative transposase